MGGCGWGCGKACEREDVGVVMGGSVCRSVGMYRQEGEWVGLWVSMGVWKGVWVGGVCVCGECGCGCVGVDKQGGIKECSLNS